MTIIVSVRMSPVCSAMAMNSSGRTRPSRGWFQRTSASAPRTMPVASSTLGWKHTSRPSVSSASRRSAASARRRGVAGSWVGSYSSQPLRWRRAASAAMWARWTSDGTSIACSGYTAMPTLTLRASSTPSVWNGGSNPAMSRRAAPTTASESVDVGQDDGELLAAQPGQDGGLGQQPADAAARLDEQAVGAAVAEGVDDLAERVEVDDQQPDPAPGRVGGVEGVADAGRSSRARLGRPVSGSWVAWCARSAASRSSRWNSMPFSMAIDAWAASEPSSPASALPNDATALRRAWVTTSAPTTVRSVDGDRRGHGVAVGQVAQPARRRGRRWRPGTARRPGMSARRSLRCWTRRHVGQLAPGGAEADPPGRLALAGRAAAAARRRRPAAACAPRPAPRT